MAKSKKQVMKETLDRIVQQIYVPLNPKCLVCGEKTAAMHHYIQKSQSLWLRWDIRNLVPLCAPCHTRHHRSGDPRIHQEIIRVKGHEWADELERDRRILFKDNLRNLKSVKDDLTKGVL